VKRMNYILAYSIYEFPPFLIEDSDYPPTMMSDSSTFGPTTSTRLLITPRPIFAQRLLCLLYLEEVNLLIEHATRNLQ